MALIIHGRLGRWPWEAIRDDGAISARKGGGDDGPEDFWGSVRWSAENYRRDLHEGQPSRVVVWCEAAGMVPQIASAIGRLPAFVACGGGA